MSRDGMDGWRKVTTSASGRGKVSSSVTILWSAGDRSPKMPALVALSLSFFVHIAQRAP